MLIFMLQIFWKRYTPFRGDESLNTMGRGAQVINKTIFCLFGCQFGSVLSNRSAVFYETKGQWNKSSVKARVVCSCCVRSRPNAMLCSISIQNPPSCHSLIWRLIIRVSPSPLAPGGDQNLTCPKLWLFLGWNDAWLICMVLCPNDEYFEGGGGQKTIGSWIKGWEWDLGTIHWGPESEQRLDLKSMEKGKDY